MSGERTKRGLQFIILSQFLTAAFALAGAFLFFFLLLGEAALSDLTEHLSFDVFTSGGFWLFAFLGICTALVVVLCIWIAGISNIFFGRNEFGQKHARSVMLGCILIVAAIILQILPYGGSFSGLAIMIGYTMILNKIARDFDKKLMTAAFVIVVGTTILGFFRWTLNEVLGYELKYLWSIQFAIAVAYFAAYVFILAAYIRTYLAIRSGTIKPPDDWFTRAWDT